MSLTEKGPMDLLTEAWSNLIHTEPRQWLPALVVLVSIAVVGWIAKFLMKRWLGRIAAHTKTRLDDVLLATAENYWFAGTLWLAFAAAVRITPLDGELRTLAGRALLAGFLLVVVLAAARFVNDWLGERAADNGGAKSSLLQASARVAVLLAGFLVVLDNLGFQMAPLLTALGVGSLAVGLALQPTLSNFFAGMHLSVAKPIRVGDFIELEDGTQGFVVDIGWRATHLRQPANNLIVVPNARLADMRLINYSLPEGPQNIVMTIGVAYGSDLPQVERVAAEVGLEVQKEIPEADPEHTPTVRFHTFADSAIEFNIILRARSYADRFPLIHAFVKALHARFQREGIEIPFPQRVVHTVEHPAEK